MLRTGSAQNPVHKAQWEAWKRAKEEVEGLCGRGLPLHFLQEREATDPVLWIARRDGQQVQLNYRQPQEGDPYKGDRAVKRRKRDSPQVQGST